MKTVTTTELVEELVRKHWDLIDTGCDNSWFPVQLAVIVLCDITKHGDITLLADDATVADYTSAIEEVKVLIDRKQRAQAKRIA